jgi:hypothetical protein
MVERVSVRLQRAPLGEKGGPVYLVVILGYFRRVAKPRAKLFSIGHGLLIFSPQQS